MSDAPDPAVLERALTELLGLEREVIELGYVRRADALDRVRDALRRLGELGSPDAVIARAAEEFGTSSQFDRVLLSEVAGGVLRPRAMWTRERSGGRPTAVGEIGIGEVRLEYPTREHEVAQRPQVVTVDLGDARSRASPSLAAAFGWSAYIVAAVTVRGETIGLLHADATASARRLDALDAELVTRFAEGLGGVFERAVLRDTVRSHREELQSAIRWMSGRLSELSGDTPDSAAEPPHTVDAGAVDVLTPREREVLRLLARGHTNKAIAEMLVVREGTIKYHVKNILRKLGATSRADAVSRFARATR
jgi:DNA-binding CsgD family transcriptional regulator